jgi:hypothetical protein
LRKLVGIAGGIILLAVLSLSVFFIFSSRKSVVKVVPVVNKKSGGAVSLSFSDGQFLVRIKGRRVRSLFTPAIGGAEVTIQSCGSENLLLKGTADKVLVNKEKLTFLDFRGEGCNGKLVVNIKKLILENGNLSMGGYQLRGNSVFIFGKKLCRVNFEKLCRSPVEWMKKVSFVPHHK